MNRKEILSMVDHTLLKNTATWDDIKAIIDDAIKYNAASVCIPPAFVKKAVDYSGNRIPVCTVIGFPLGYATTEAKVFEAKNAVDAGAKEIDAVINVSKVKSGEYGYVLNELKQLRIACSDSVLKVIIEACLLTEDEKIKMCSIVSESGADFIKTSTGFSTGGATLDDVRLMREYCSEKVKVKAAGGIRSFEDAEKFIAAGASRLGTSALVNIFKSEDK